MRRQLTVSVSTIALVVTALALGATPTLAAAQEAEEESAPAPADEIVVTGTSIRGVAPIGSNLVSLDRDLAEKTAAINATELTNTLPAISTAGSAPMGENVFSYYSPQIHSLAGSASNTTLVLIDGMRIPGGGTQYGQTDPNIIPTSAIQRVEVLADGASSVYGSDAVAGVVNYITRPSFSGAEIAAKAGFADDWHSFDVNGIWGAKWDTGGLYVAAQYSYQSPMRNDSRDFLSMGDYRSVGGRNTNSFNCSPATIRTPSSGTSVYLSPAATTTTAAVTDNSPCNNSIYADSIQSNKRANMLVRFNNSFGDRFSFTGTVNYNFLRGKRALGPGLINAVTVFGPGSGRGGQINPFYVAPAGDPGAVQEAVTYAAILPGDDYGTQQAKNDTLYLYGNAEYKLSDSWFVKLSNAYGYSRSYLNTYDAFCNSCALLALNGTATTTGSLTASNVAGQNVVTLNLPLTSANALDVWQPNGGRTSAAVLANLYSNQTQNMHLNTYNQTKLEAQGSVFSLPAGEVRVAVGGEYYWVKQHVESVDPANIGSTAVGSAFRSFTLSRDVYSGYLEVVVPVVSEDMNIPLVRQFDLNLSGRYDHYSDVGGTTNPKVAANWEVIRGLKLRGNYATAFVAPPMITIGIPQFGYQRGATGVTAAPTMFVPVDIYPEVKLLPGCATAVTVCQIGTAANQGLSRVYGIGPDAKPQTGNSWSLGVDFTPPEVPGLRASLTYWSNKFVGGVNRPEVTQQLYSTALRDRLTICPTGCTTAQINEFANAAGGGTISTALPATVYFMNNNDQGNLLNMVVQGIDLNLIYRAMTDAYGNFTFGASGTYYTRFDQDLGDEPFSTLNTSGYNSSFPSIQKRFRFQVGWEMGDFSMDTFLNYTGAYRNWGNLAVTPLILNADNAPIGGGDPVRADATLDLHVEYRLSFGETAGANLFLDVKNVFDRDPPFFSGNTSGIGVGGYGYNGYVSNPIGRIVAVGLRADF